VATVPTDEIYEKYLQKAILEINELGDEIARTAGPERMRVVGSGHPLADLFLLKYGPQPSEFQEGVAFFGRSGQAILKSLQRLRVDPTAVYGTNCLKLAEQDEEEARPWLARELHIVQPKLVVVMGEDALRFLNELEFPLADALEPELGVLQRFTPTADALCVPDIDASLDEQPAKTRFWQAFKLVGSWWAELPPY
jgi:uracil-DNA glycosylase